MFRKSLLFAGFTISALILLSSTSCTRLSSPAKRVVVRVNEAEFSAEDFSLALAQKLKSFNSLSAKDVGVISQAKATVVHDFIVQTLTQDWASKNEIFVRKEQLDNEIEKTRKDYPDDSTFRQSLAMEGLSYEEWEGRLKYMLLERLVIEKLRSSISNITSEDVSKYYQEHKNEFLQPAQSRLRQIVVDTEDAAKKIQDELRRKRSFAELAQKFSKTPEASKGGDLGWVERGTLEVFDQAMRLGVGQRSNILRSPYGFHIIETTARRPAKTLTLQEVEKQIRRTILQEREQALYSRWIEEQLLKAKVFKDEDLLNQIRVQTRGP
ncbi:MAG: peptidyl-prolyl cis-trans isomerase [Bdellovibrionota bacterium]